VVLETGIEETEEIFLIILSRVHIMLPIEIGRVVGSPAG
jgi:hypothetical protein